MPDSAATNPAEATTSADPLHQLRRTNLREVRATVKPGRLERSTARALFGLGVDFTGYLLCMAGVFVADALWLQALSGLGAGCFVAFFSFGRTTPRTVHCSRTGASASFWAPLRCCPP